MTTFIAPIRIPCSVYQCKCTYTISLGSALPMEGCFHASCYAGQKLQIIQHDQSQEWDMHFEMNICIHIVVNSFV